MKVVLGTRDEAAKDGCMKVYKERLGVYISKKKVNEQLRKVNQYLDGNKKFVGKVESCSRMK